MLTDAFATDGEKEFLKAFEWLVPHVRKTDFVIDLDFEYNGSPGYEWAGYTAKRHAKATLMKQMVENSDFVIKHADNSLDRRESILLSESGFLTLAFHAHTARGSRTSCWIVKLRDFVADHREQVDKRELASSAAQLDHLSCTMDTLRYEMALTHTPSQLYVFSTDASRPDAYLKIGYTKHVIQRGNELRQACPKGRMMGSVPIRGDIPARTVETFVHCALREHRMEGENFSLSVDDAMGFITLVQASLQLMVHPDPVARREKIAHLLNAVDTVVFNRPSAHRAHVVRHEMSTQTEDVGVTADAAVDDEAVRPPAAAPVPPPEAPEEDEFRFADFIAARCDVTDPMAETATVDLAGAYRLWMRRATKVAYTSLLAYLETRFRPVRLAPNPAAGQHVVNGYRGVALLPTPGRILPLSSTEPERFLHQSVAFVPRGKVLWNQLRGEYVKWLNRIRGDAGARATEDDVRQLRAYLHTQPDCLWSNLWAEQGNGQGWYGIHLLVNEPVRATRRSSTGRRVEKVNTLTGEVLGEWTTIAEAAAAEGMYVARMSRMISGRVELPGQTIMYRTPDVPYTRLVRNAS